MSRLLTRIAVFTCIALVILLSVIGVYEFLNERWGVQENWAGFTVGGIVAITWVAIAVGQRLSNPISTLVLSGITYAVIITILRLITQIFLGEMGGMPLRAIVVGSGWLIVEWALLGAVLGVIVRGLQRLRHRPAEPSIRARMIRALHFRR